MSQDILIGLDAGTSVIKAIAFTADGREIAAAERPNRYERTGEDGVEQDMIRTWTDAAAVLRQLVESTPDLAARVAGVAVTGQGDGTWLADETGEPVAPALLWLDSRAASLVEEFGHSAHAAWRYEVTGTGLNACQQNMQLLWLKQNRPEAIARAATAFHCKDWLYWKLCGERATDPSEGLFTFGSFRTRAYEPALLEAFGIAGLARLIPPIVDGATHAGGLTPDAAAATGLKTGTPVTLGYVDVVCTGLGGGLFDPSGTAGCTILGSTGMHMRFVGGHEAVRLNTERTGYTMAFPTPDGLVQIQSNMAATLNIDWLLDVAREVLSFAGVTHTRRDLLSEIDGRLLDATPAAALFHPYIFEAGERGPFTDAHARAQFLGLSTRTGYLGLMRSIYEGLALAARDCYAAMGPIPSEIRLTGGAARSEAMRRIFASVLGSPVRTVSRAEAGAAGAAMIAAVQLGFYNDMKEAAAAWVDPLLGEAEPGDPALKPTYDQLFDLYQDTRRAAPPLWRGLARMRPGTSS